MILGAILGALLLFFSFKKKYVSEGEKNAENRATKHALQRASKGIRNAQNADTFNYNDINRMLTETGAEYGKHGERLQSSP